MAHHNVDDGQSPALHHLARIDADRRAPECKRRDAVMGMLADTEAVGAIRKAARVVQAHADRRTEGGSGRQYARAQTRAFDQKAVAASGGYIADVVASLQ